MTDEQLAAFVAPAAPLTINNPDRLVEVDASGKAKVAFAAGPLTLPAADVPRYLSLHNPQESDLNRLARHQLVWQAWLAAVKASSNPNVVPGETTSGLGRYVRGLAKGNVQFSTLPATAQSDSSGAETFVPDANRVAALMTSFVPLPTPASPGDRVEFVCSVASGPSTCRSCWPPRSCRLMRRSPSSATPIGSTTRRPRSCTTTMRSPRGIRVAAAVRCRPGDQEHDPSRFGGCHGHHREGPRRQAGIADHAGERWWLIRAIDGRCSRRRRRHRRRGSIRWCSRSATSWRSPTPS